MPRKIKVKITDLKIIVINMFKKTLKIKNLKRDQNLKLSNGNSRKCNNHKKLIA